MKAMKYINLGRMRYQQALEIQQQIARKHLDGLTDVGGVSKVEGQDTLLIVEHQPVYTIGLRTKNYNLQDEENLKSLGAEFYRTNRGGLITFHGPGQLVAYPVINLKHFKLGMRDYVCWLEKTIIRTCANFGVSANTTENTGVWVGNNKIAALGIHASRSITTHGLALNCNTDLSWYSHIVPCGIEGKGITSLSKETDTEITIETTLPVLLDNFSTVFNCNIEEEPCGTMEQAQTLP